MEADSALKPIEAVLAQVVSDSLNKEKRITVLKGFNRWISSVASWSDVLLDFEPLNRFENENPSIALMTRILDRLSSQRSMVCLYEDLILLSKYQLLGTLEGMGYSVDIIVNDVFPGMYPVSMLQSDWDDFHNNVECPMQSYYAELIDVDGVTYCVYGDAGELNGYQQYNMSQFRNVCWPLVEGSNATINLSAEKAVLCSQVLAVIEKQYRQVRLQSDGIQINNQPGVNHALSAAGYVFVENPRETAAPAHDHSEYLEILRRKSSTYSFRDIEFYEDPVVSNQLELVNQADIIDRLVGYAEQAQSDGDFLDLFVTAPTGSGKSILFQIPAIYLAERYELVTIVVSPLISLMHDQAKNVRDMTDRAVTINSDFNPEQKEQIKSQLQSGESSILYIAPETLIGNSDIRSLIGDRKIGLVVIDEAHIVSTWGKTFRPNYWHLGDYIHRLRHSKDSQHRFPVAAFTATATIGGVEDTYSDILEMMRITPYTMIGRIRRDDISFDIRRHEQVPKYDEVKMNLAAESIRKLRLEGKKTLVYCPYRRQVDDLYKRLHIEGGYSRYHAGLPTNDRRNAVCTLERGENTVMLATKAFGMGVDIEDIEYVYHFAPTGTLADYVQEIGRCARKPGLSGVACTDHFSKDFRFINQLNGMSRIKDYEVVGVLNKLLELRKRAGSQNFLVRPEEFDFLLSDKGSNESNSDSSRLQLVLLVIKSDFEADTRINYPPVIFKPQSMFTKGYFAVNSEFADLLRSTSYWSYFHRITTPSVTYGRSGGQPMKVTRIYDVYEVSFAGLWEDHFRDLSFSKFKSDFYSNKLPDFNFMVQGDPKYAHGFASHQAKLTPHVVIQLSCRDTGHSDFAQLRSYIFKVLDEIKRVFAQLHADGKYFSEDEVAHLVGAGETIKGISANPMFVEMVSRGIPDLISRVRPKESDFGKRFWNIRYGKVQVGSTYYERVFKSIRRAVADMLAEDDQTRQTYYLSHWTANHDPRMIVAQLIQMLDVADCQLSRGSQPELFVRVNSVAPIERIVNNPSYRSRTLRELRDRHEKATALMKVFFEKLDHDESRWQFIEDYFLGRISGDDETVE